jgi:hypothetical protein
MHDRGDQPLERLSRYEHRLEQSFHRCLRDLHVLKQRAKQYADEPPSPFRSQWVLAGEEEHPPHRGLGVPPERSSAATEKPEDNELGRDAQATEEADNNAPVQNEATAENPAASVGPAEGCGASAVRATSPDAEEMARLRKFTDLLSRCRPRDDEEDDPEDDMS